MEVNDENMLEGSSADLKSGVWSHLCRLGGSRAAGCCCRSCTGCPETSDAAAVSRWAVWTSRWAPSDRTRRHQETRACRVTEGSVLYCFMVSFMSHTFYSNIQKQLDEISLKYKRCWVKDNLDISFKKPLQWPIVWWLLEWHYCVSPTKTWLLKYMKTC